MIKAIGFFCAVLICVFKFGYAYNITTSLPYKHFLIIKHSKVKIDDYVLFAAPEFSVYKGYKLIKQVNGKSLDKITVNDRAVYINNKYVGDAKKQSLTGDSLDIIQEQTIPANKLYVGGTSADSFDSRYSNFGLIDENTIIGIAIPLW